MSEARNVCFTINNYNENSLDLLKTWNQVSYLVYGYETAPTTGTKHLQGYVEFKTSKKWDTIHKKIPGGNTKKRFGTAKQAAGYCMKGSNDTPPYDRFMDNPADDWEGEEIGQISKQGERGAIGECTDLIQQGGTLRQVAQLNPYAFVKYHRGFQALKATLIEPRDEEILDIKVYWGITRTGKTTQAKKDLGKDYYRWTPTLGKWHEGYEGQENVLYEEFRGQISLGDILVITEPGQVKVQVKGGAAEFRGKKIRFTSPKHPRDWYSCDYYDRIDQLIGRIGEHNIIELTEQFERKTT